MVSDNHNNQDIAQEDAHIVQQAEGSPLDSLVFLDCLHDKV